MRILRALWIRVLGLFGYLVKQEDDRWSSQATGL
jgi:hypothetical protein